MINLNRLLAIFLLMLLTSCTATESNLERLFKEYTGNVPGAAVMIVENGKIVVQEGFGIANFSDNSPVSSTTNFRLASVTKQFTALATLQLIEQKKLQLSTPLSNVLAGLPDWSRQVTIRDLLRHTSGIKDYEGLVEENRQTQVVDADVLELLKDQPELYFEPGTQYQYSNSGYALLALIVEQISEQSFSDYLDEHIFQPLNMSSSVALVHSVHSVENRAYGYALTEGGDHELADQSIYSAVLGDGGIYSNLLDLYQWILALDNKSLLATELSEAWLSDQKNIRGEDINYGFGWRLENYRGLEVTYHTGISRGFRNVLYRVPDKQFTIVILTNRTTDADLAPLQMARKIVDWKFFDGQMYE